MRPADPAVTIVIPSRGLRERAGHLRCAVDSVKRQGGVRAIPLVILNGAQVAREVESELRGDAEVRVLAHPTASLQQALRLGREKVDTPWFGALDDDDVLLPGALAVRVAELEQHPDGDVVVTNGFVREGGRDDLHMLPEHAVAADPLRALVERNWLLPGSWLARTDRVGPSLFDGMPRYRECTFLALRFSAHYRMRWMEAPTVVYQRGSPHAETASRAYVLGQVEAVRQLLALELPPVLRRRMQWEVTASLHAAADSLWCAGDIREAWLHHLRTLRAPGGLHFLPFTRHLLGASLRRVMGRTVQRLA